MTTRLALTRPVSPAIVHCELTHLAREPIDVKVARDQHLAYEVALTSLGCTLVRVPEAPDLPDSVFVEDTAVVLDELAIITHPGAPSRRAELDGVADALARYRALCWIQPPATLDGGDVFVMERRIFVGRSGRTNADGIEQLRTIVAPFQYEVHIVEQHDCLHLKTAASPVAAGTLLIHRDWVDTDAFREFELIDIDREEPFAANAVLVGNDVICAAEFPRTREVLVRRGISVTPVPASELAKAEGGVTCCSIVFEP
ncbi:MAG: dimethylarginine dimethylaminohydrolase family protein [Longimicrobiales bacterium]